MADEGSRNSGSLCSVSRRLAVSFKETWSGDWHSRVLERVRQLGFETVTQYADKRPGVSLPVLAEELGPGDVAATQIRSILVEEAIRTHTVPRVLRDLLVRELRQGLPQGWKYPPDDRSHSMVVRTLGRWELELKDHLDDKATLVAGRELMNAELPTGWLPGGPDDPVIVAFVDRCLGRQPS
jgi:hypothetical protein